MIELHIRPGEEDEEGWAEVMLVTQPMDKEGTAYVANQDGNAEGETVGYVRVVEGTEGTAGPTWWDARVIEDGARYDRRFVSLEGALLALAVRAHLPRDEQKLVGW